MKYNFCVPCLMGVEGLVADELRFNGFENVSAENGRVFFDGDMAECARANIILRCGERVLLVVGKFRADTFDMLFEGVKALKWEKYIDRLNAFPVKGHSVHSKLFSIPDCQRIIKKAVVERLRSALCVSALPETGAKIQIQFSIIDDMAYIFLDTTGAPLYKRGYRLASNEAPIRETLAAAMVKIARYKGREDFYDVFCGSGTIAIEAAMAAMNIAPGAGRSFDAENWAFYDTSVWKKQKAAAIERENRVPMPIHASDISPQAVQLCKDNIKRAGLEGLIEVKRADALGLDYTGLKGTMIINPPYGQRLLDMENAHEIYEQLGQALKKAPELKKYIITSDEKFETYFGKKADKKRKLYNGMIKCNLYMYYK